MSENAHSGPSGELKGKKMNPIERLATDPKSKAKAIKAKCFDCVGQGYDPNWRKAVGTCPCRDCPLHGVRPYQYLNGK